MSIQHRHRSHYLHTIKRRIKSVWYNGTTTSCVIADNAAYQDLHDAAFTVDVWFRADGYGEGNQGVSHQPDR